MEESLGIYCRGAPFFLADFALRFVSLLDSLVSVALAFLLLFVKYMVDDVCCVFSACSCSCSCSYFFFVYLPFYFLAFLPVCSSAFLQELFLLALLLCLFRFC